MRPYKSENNIFEFGIHLKEKYWGKGFAQLIKKLGFTYTHDEFYPPTGLQHPSYMMTEQDYKLNKVFFLRLCEQKYILRKMHSNKP